MECASTSNTATEKVGKFKVCKNINQISHRPGWHQDHSGLHSSTESFFYSDARPICLLSPRIFRVSRTSSTDIFQDFLSEGAFNSLFFLISHFFSLSDMCSTWAMWKKLTWPALTRRSWSRNILVLIELDLWEKSEFWIVVKFRNDKVRIMVKWRKILCEMSLKRRGRKREWGGEEELY